MKLFTFLSVALLGLSTINAQQNPVYATMDAGTALQYKASHPEMIQILESRNRVAAVVLDEALAIIIRSDVTTHGSNYIFMDSPAKALAVMESSSRTTIAPAFSITETAFVNECLDLVNIDNIEDNIILLQNYGTRYHTKPSAQQAVLDQKAKWDAWIAASGRTDIHTRIYNHTNTPMPSVILTIDGAENPLEFVIVGGHIDSTSSNRDDAPGADDNASGISSLNEMVRILLEKNFVPSKTIEVMAFAAEEIGLVGSAEIAAEYAANGVNVLGYVQFDMTGFNGSSDDVYIMNDWYTSGELNGFLVELMDHYNGSGDHSFTYNFSQCGYGCSDHASWSASGYHASMPFEAAMGEDNPFIHTPNDTFSVLETGEHAVKFTKIALEFVVEAAKQYTLGVSDFQNGNLQIYMRNRNLFYSGTNGFSVEKINIFNMTGQQVLKMEPVRKENAVNLETLSAGVYLVEFVSNTQKSQLKRIVLR